MRGNEPSEHVIVGEFVERGKAADADEDLVADRHRRTETIAQRLDRARDEDARREVFLDPHRTEFGDQPADGLAAVERRNRAHAGIVEARRDRLQVIALDADVGVGDDHDLAAGFALAARERAHFGIAARGVVADGHLSDPRPLRDDGLRDGQRRVVARAHAERRREGPVILCAQGMQMFGQPRFVAVQRLERGDRRAAPRHAPLAAREAQRAQRRERRVAACRDGQHRRKPERRLTKHGARFHN